MQIQCPACGKSNDMASNTACARCGCDLGQLACILRHAAHQLELSAQALTMRQWAAALAHAEHSWSLRHSIESARCCFLAAAALGQAQRVWHWQQTIHLLERND